MKILFIAPSFPYPPDSGGQMRSWNLLRYLAEKGQVTLVGIGRPEQYEPYLPVMKEHCSQVFLADPKKFISNQELGRFVSIRERIRKLVRLQPWLLDDFVDPEILKQIRNVKPEQYDLIVIRFTIMAYYFLTQKEFRSLAGKIVVDVDDVNLIVQERAVKNLKWGYPKLRSFFDLWLLKLYYAKLKAFSACFVVSSKDKNYLLDHRINENVFLVPNVYEVNGKPATHTVKAVKPEILFCGTMSYPPNQDAVFYFCNHVFPAIQAQIPDAHVTIVGKHVRENVKNLGSRPGISVAGHVPSMEPYYQKAAIAVTPLLNGGGTRIKILEAMAHGTPVVSTSIGAEGLDVVSGENILIADHPADFAQKCVDLLKNSELRNKIASNGYRLVKEKYDIGVFHQKMNEVFEFVEQNVCAVS